MDTFEAKNISVSYARSSSWQTIRKYVRVFLCYLLLINTTIAAAVDVMAPQGGVVRSVSSQSDHQDFETPKVSAASTIAENAVVASDVTVKKAVNTERNVEIDSDGKPHSLTTGVSITDVEGRFSLAAAASPTGNATIDSMTVTGAYYSSTYYPGDPIYTFGGAGIYTLSNGSTWSSGAGSYRQIRLYLDHVEISGTTVRYILQPPADGLVYQQTDYNGGDHSAQGELGVAGPLLIVNHKV